MKKIVYFGSFQDKLYCGKYENNEFSYITDYEKMKIELLKILKTGIEKWKIKDDEFGIYFKNNIIVLENINLIDNEFLKPLKIELNKKIENAELYIKEIDEHKKSIFEFWKFTNKDKKAELVGGEIKEENTKKLKKVFNYELDFEDLSKQLDKKQRLELTQAETNSIYIATTDIINDINTVANGEKITEERLEKVKEVASKEKILFENEPFDIFGAIESNNNYVKNTVGEYRKLKSTTILYSNSDLTGTKYTYLPNTTVKILKNISSTVDYVYIKATNRYAYINIYAYTVYNNVALNNLVGKTKVLKSNTNIYAYKTMSGKFYSYLPNTRVRVLQDLGYTTQYYEELIYSL